MIFPFLRWMTLHRESEAQLRYWGSFMQRWSWIGSSFVLVKTHVISHEWRLHLMCWKLFFFCMARSWFLILCRAALLNWIINFHRGNHRTAAVWKRISSRFPGPMSRRCLWDIHRPFTAHPQTRQPWRISKISPASQRSFLGHIRPVEHWNRVKFVYTRW